jgi:hypothetical protein
LFSSIYYLFAISVSVVFDITHYIKYILRTICTVTRYNIIFFFFQLPFIKNNNDSENVHYALIFFFIFILYPSVLSFALTIRLLSHFHSLHNIIIILHPTCNANDFYIYLGIFFFFFQIKKKQQKIINEK